MEEKEGAKKLMLNPGLPLRKTKEKKKKGGRAGMESSWGKVLERGGGETERGKGGGATQKNSPVQLKRKGKINGGRR